MKSILQHRIVAAIRGACVADAASMGTHWIYNPKDMLTAVTSVDRPEFTKPPKPNYYSSTEFPNHYEHGMLSPYGEVLLFVTKYISEHSDDMINGDKMSHALLEFASTFGGRPDHAMTTFMENMKTTETQWPNCGADDDQAHIYTKMVPVVCNYVNHETKDLLLKVEEIIRVHQNNDTAVAFGIASARILQGALLLPSSDSSSLPSLVQVLDSCLVTLPSDIDMVLGSKENAGEIKDLVIKSFERGKSAATEFDTLDDFLLQLSHEKMAGQSDNAFYDMAARSCGLPGSFTGPIYLLYKLASVQEPKSDNDAYVSAIRENILAAGDTCSRSIMIGAVLAAVSATTSSSSTTAFDTLIQEMEENTMKEIDSAATLIANKH